MADEFVYGVNFQHVFMDTLGQLVFGKCGEGAAEGGFTGNLPGTFPAAELPQQRARLEGVNQRARGGELIDMPGHKSVRQPGPFVGRAAVAAPLVRPGEAAQIGEQNHFAELLIQGAQRAEFGRECGEELPLQVVKDRRQVRHERQTPQSAFRLNKTGNIPHHHGF